MATMCQCFRVITLKQPGIPIMIELARHASMYMNLSMHVRLNVLFTLSISNHTPVICW